jgi:5'-3' exonuclease
MGNNLKKYYIFDQVLHTQVRDSIIIIDGSIWLHQALSSYRTVSGDLFTSKNGVITSHIYGLLHKMVPLITRGNRLIFCIDGSKLPEKEENTKNRRVQRQNHKRVLQNLKNCLNITREQIYIASKRVIQVTPDLFTTVEYFLKYMGIPYVRGENEAESQCAYIQQTLTAKGIKSYVYTPDSDALIFGADNIIMAQNRGVYQIASLSKTLQSVRLSRIQLVDVVLLSGGDYTTGVRGVGCITAMKLIKKYGSLVKIPSSCFSVASQQSFKLLLNNYEHLQGLYNRAPVNLEFDIEWKKPDLQSLESFLVDELNFSRHQLIPLANYYIRLGI